MVVGEAVLRRPRRSAVEAAIDAGVQDGGGEANLAVVERAGVADGVRHVAIGEGVRRRRSRLREVEPVRGVGELTRRLPGHVPNSAVGDRERRLRAAVTAGQIHGHVEARRRRGRDDLRRGQEEQREDGQSKEGEQATLQHLGTSPGIG